MKKITVVLILAFAITPLIAEQPTERFETVVNKMVKAINEADYPGIQAIHPNHTCTIIFKIRP